MNRFALVLAAVLVVVPAAAKVPPPDWVSPLGRDHPLAGRIWQPGDGRFVAPEDAAGLVSRARFVLIGEKHDNADHHRLQAWLVQRIAAAHRPAIALEAIDRSQEPALKDFLARHPADADGLGAALDWARSGWPDWRHYAPIVAPVLAQGGPVLATVPSRDTLRAVMRRGVAALPPERVKALGLASDLPSAERATLMRAIDEGHCRQLPAGMVGPMTTVQRVKDAAMAEALMAGAKSPGRDMAILIAGTGHVRTDHGVPWHLRRLAPEAGAIAVGMIEVQKEITAPPDYGAAFGVARLPFDIVWFTPRTDDNDPCAEHADRLRRVRERGGDTEAR